MLSPSGNHLDCSNASAHFPRPSAPNLTPFPPFSGRSSLLLSFCVVKDAIKVAFELRVSWSYWDRGSVSYWLLRRRG